MVGERPQDRVRKQRDGNPEIYVMDADGGNQTRVTNDPTAVDINPSWSPDGQRIAFQRRTTGLYDIYAVDIDGEGLVNLTNGQGGSEPAWSPDGTKIAYISGNNVFSMNADGTDRTMLTNYPTPSRESFREPGNPDWSPDGSQITYDLIFGGSSHFYNSIHIMNADGSGDVEHFFGSEVVTEPAFSPDGAEIVFTCDAGLCFLPPPGTFLPVPLPGVDRFDVSRTGSRSCRHRSEATTRIQREVLQGRTGLLRRRKFASGSTAVVPTPTGSASARAISSAPATSPTPPAPRL